MAYEFRQSLLGSERHNLRSTVLAEHVDFLEKQGCQREPLHGPASALLEPWVAPGQLLWIISERNEGFRPQLQLRKTGQDHGATLLAAGPPHHRPPNHALCRAARQLSWI